MLRPRYETEVDRSREAKVANYIARMTKTELRKIGEPMSWEPADYLQLRGEFNPNRPALMIRQAIWEIKCRDYVWDFFDQYGYMLSEKKVQRAFDLAGQWANFGVVGFHPTIKAINLPVIICVRTLDPQLWTCTLDSPDALKGVPMAMGGRKDRNDPKDIEPCYFFPAHMFKRFA